MPTKTDTRMLGYAVTKLFKDAFATYRNEIYKVTDVISGNQIILDSDVYASMKQRIHLFDPNMVLNLPEISPEMEGAEYSQEFMQKVPIKEIRKVICKMDEDLLQTFMCKHCHAFFKRLTPITSINRFAFECPMCSRGGGRQVLTQAPILFYNKPIQANRRAPALLRSIPAKKCPTCTAQGRDSWLGLYIKDKNRPMFSLTRECATCRYEETLKVMPYRPIQPSEQLTKGITVSIAKALQPEPLSKIDLLNDKFVEGISFSDKVMVSQVTFGYMLGYYTTTVAQSFNDEFFGRKFKTQGFVMRLKPEFYQEAQKYLKEVYTKDPDLYTEFEKDIKGEEGVNELQLKRWVLHSLQHALLTMLPVFTGLPSSEFDGSYDLDKNQVIIYDNQEGGIGGCRKFKENPELFYDFFETIGRILGRCDCRNKCPKCIASDKCGEVNQALNRHLLARLFDNLETEYD